MALKIDRPGTPAAMRAALRWEGWYLPCWGWLLLPVFAAVFLAMIAFCTAMMGGIVLLSFALLSGFAAGDEVAMRHRKENEAGTFLLGLPAPRPLFWRQRWATRFQQFLVFLLVMDAAAAVPVLWFPRFAEWSPALLLRGLILSNLGGAFVFHVWSAWGVPGPAGRRGMASLARWLGYLALAAAVVAVGVDSHTWMMATGTSPAASEQPPGALQAVSRALDSASIPICLALVLGTVAEFVRAEAGFVRGLYGRERGSTCCVPRMRWPLPTPGCLAGPAHRLLVGRGHSPVRALVWRELLVEGVWFSLLGLVWIAALAPLLGPDEEFPDWWRISRVALLAVLLGFPLLAAAVALRPPGSLGPGSARRCGKRDNPEDDDRFMIALFGSRKRWLLATFGAYVLCTGIGLALAAIVSAVTGLLARLLLGVPLEQYGVVLAATLGLFAVCTLLVPVAAPCVAVVHALSDLRRGAWRQGLTLASVSVVWVLLLIVAAANWMRPWGWAIFTLLVAGSIVFHVLYRLKASFR